MTSNHTNPAGASAVMPEGSRAAKTDLARLADAAAAGDEHAWAGLVHRFDRLLRSVARSYGLGAADIEDAVQNTWLKAWCHLDQLRDPNAIGSWLVAMLRRDALRTLQRGVREVLTDTPPDGREPQSPSAEQALIDRECVTFVRDAVDRLSGRQHQVISCLMASPRPSYEEISARLEMPIGSIGPTRERALEQLRRDRELRQLAVA
jgi:RNA polymerase sigma factor (sigma-70 family)